MVDDSQYAVVSSALRESHDQVHGYLGEWGVIVGYRDLVQGSLGSVREVFVLLTGRASFDVLRDSGLPPRPTETVEDFPDGFVPPGVTRQSVVVRVHDALSDSLVRQDDRFLHCVHPEASVVYPSLCFLPDIELGLVLSAHLR